VPALGVSGRWIEKRKPYWDKLEALVTTAAQRGIGALPHADLRDLASLYRQTAADLSVAREDPSSAALARYLNTLLGRAHNLIYSGDAPARGLLHFYARVYPTVFRQTLPYTLAAFALFLAGMIGGTAIAWADPGFERVLLGGQMLDTIERGEMWTHSIVSIKPLASSAIMTNNLMVSFGAFAGGMLAGVGTVYMMVFNGLLIGVVSLACARASLGVGLWSFVAPHGALELPAIFIAGGAGLLLAKGMLSPGFLTRRESLTQSAALAIRLLLGVIPMLVIAGLIEGFVSPTAIPPAMKFAIGASMLVLLGAYLFSSARLKTRPTEDSAPSR
jgi:uncharacterized membrane protein SpoIIM required for sporulation